MLLKSHYEKKTVLIRMSKNSEANAESSLAQFVYMERRRETRTSEVYSKQIIKVLYHNFKSEEKKLTKHFR